MTDRPLISCVLAPDAAESRSRQIRGDYLIVNITSAALNKIAELVTTGKLATRVGATLPLSEARAAHEMLERVRRTPAGKIVLLAE
jgi:NADPH:quinone reductase-like Zn-dependent oxidoreductase